MSFTHPDPPSALSMHGMGYGDFVITTDSPSLRPHTSLPSMDNSAGDRARGEIWSFTTPRPGRMTDRNESDRGAMGVRRNASVSGWEIGPPADNE